MLMHYVVINNSLCIVLDSRRSAAAPLWHPVVRCNMAAVWKHLLKHLPVVVGFFGVRNHATELRAGLI